MSEHFLCLFKTCLSCKSLIKISGLNARIDIFLACQFWVVSLHHPQRNLNLRYLFKVILSNCAKSEQ